MRSPVNSSEEPEFVKRFHAAFGAHVMEGFGGAAKGEAKAKAQPLMPNALVKLS